MMGAGAAGEKAADPPVADSVTPNHPKVAELRALSLWSEGRVSSNPDLLVKPRS